MLLVPWKRVCAVFVVGAVLLVAGGGMIPLVDMLVRNKIKETVVISNTSEMWDVFSDPPIPIYMQFYMFNLSNPMEVKQGAKPDVMQSGPYTYRERRKKYDIVFNDNGTVTYRQKRTFFFQRNMSVGSDDDLFTTANPPVLAVVNSLQYAPKLLREAVTDALELYKEDIFMTRPVKELLWGYTDPALSLLHKVFPHWFYTDFVGYFTNKNDTDDGLYTVVTGSKEISHLGQIQRFNGSRYLPYWTTPWANMVNGSDGTLSPPFEQDTEILPMFSSDICRSVYGRYQKDVTTRRSISLRRFVGTPDELANSTANPDNSGFCTPTNSCLPSGLLNISNCQTVDSFHIPVVVSFPHFFMADPSIINSIGGMHPVPEEHETAVDVEPWTGLVLQAFKRLQINMYVTKVDDVRITGNVRTLFLPVFWLNESMVVDEVSECYLEPRPPLRPYQAPHRISNLSVVVDESHADMLHSQLFVPLEVTSVLWKVLMAVGAFLVLLAVIATIRNCTTAPTTKPQVHSADPVPIMRSNDRVRDRRPQGKLFVQRETAQGDAGSEREPLLKGERDGDSVTSATSPSSSRQPSATPEDPTV